MQIRRTIQSTCLLLAALAVVPMAAGCGPKKEVIGQDLAVAKLPKDEVRQMKYLALNDDMPGTEVDYQEYLVPGKHTVIYFFSPYDEMTPRIGQALTQLPNLNDNVVVRTVNINRPEIQGIDWDGPIVYAEQISALPYVQIFDPHQKLRAHGRPAFELLQQWLQVVPGQPRAPVN